jgi:hypothetical protein
VLALEVRRRYRRVPGSCGTGERVQLWRGICRARQIRRAKSCYAALFSGSAAGFPQHFLYFAPDPQGQGAFLGTFVLTAWPLAAVLQNERPAWAIRFRLQNKLRSLSFFPPDRFTRRTGTASACGNAWRLQNEPMRWPLCVSPGGGKVGGRFTKRTEAGFAVALGQLPLGEGH